MTYTLSAEFELHVNATFIFETMFECDNIRMIHRLVNFDFREQLQFHPPIISAFLSER